MEYLKVGILWVATAWGMFAQSTPVPPAQESIWLAAIGTLLVIGTLISTFYTIMANRRRLAESDEPKRRLLPDPIRIASVHDLVTQPQFEKLEQKIDRRFDILEVESAQLAKDTHSRINDVLKELSTLRGAFDQSQRRHHPHDG